MRKPPSPKLALHYPVVSIVSFLAIGVSVAYWRGWNIAPLLETPAISQGQLWRLVTSILPHLNLLHLAFDIYWFWVFGTLIEEKLGHIKILALILLLAITSGAADFALMDGGVGLSGVGYGFFGLLWVLSKTDARFPNAVDKKTIELFVFWFFLCIITTYTGAMDVANLAHGAGCVLGLLIGGAMACQGRRRQLYRVAITMLTVVSLWGATFGRLLVNFSPNLGNELAWQAYMDLQHQHNRMAAKLLQQAIAHRKPEADWYYNLAVAQDRLGQVAAANKNFLKAKKLNPRQNIPQ